MIEIVKNQLDVGLLSGRPDVVEFFREEAGLEFDHVLPITKHQVQHRFVERGSVVKVNIVDRLPGDQRSGIEELFVARDGLPAARSLTDPDGNRVTFVPTGSHGVTQIGVRLIVPDLARSMAYYEEVLGFTKEARGRVRCGDSVLIFEERGDAPSGFESAQRGWLYLTVQVRSCDEETARVEGLGGEVVSAPRNLGKVARMAMVRDPDGNLLEISQRASIVGPLPTEE